jgi:hypothetical protein
MALPDIKARTRGVTTERGKNRMDAYPDSGVRRGRKRGGNLFLTFRP